jgi:Tfp pilus assembly protein PilX
MKLQAQKIKIKSEKGIALILALIIMTMLLLLTLSAFEMVTVNAQISDNHIRDLQALYVANAGIDHAICGLRGGVLTKKSCGDGTYTIDSIDNIGTNEYRIRTTGNIYESTRKIEAEVKLFGSPSNYTVVITSWKET